VTPRRIKLLLSNFSSWQC